MISFYPENFRVLIEGVEYHGWDASDVSTYYVHLKGSILHPDVQSLIKRIDSGLRGGKLIVDYGIFPEEYNFMKDLTFNVIAYSIEHKHPESPIVSFSIYTDEE